MTADVQPIIAERTTVTVEPAPPFMLIKCRQFDAAIKAMQEQQMAMMTGFAFGRGVNLQTHKVNLDTEAGTITISPILSEQST